MKGKRKNSSTKKSSVNLPARAAKKPADKRGSRARAQSGANQGQRKVQSGSEGEILRGVLERTANGYAFLRPELEGREDVFVPASAQGGALDGDTVCVRIVSTNRGGGEGEVTEIISRRDPVFVALFQGGMLYPEHKGLGPVTPESTDIKDKRGELLQDGCKVYAKLIDYKYPLIAEITELLGKAGETDTEVMGIIRSFGLREVFPKKVRREADELPGSVDEQSVAGRTDYRMQQTVTIDGEDSKDFDDAIFAERTKSGGYKLYVHIADVAHYVRRGSALDAEALLRGTSVYFADRVLPMLPEKLSNGICSLNEGEDRLTLSLMMEFDESFTRVGHALTEGVIRSKARMTYTNVQKILDGDKDVRKTYKPLLPMLETAFALSKGLRGRRDSRGSVDFDAGECEIEVDKRGKVLDVRIAPRNWAHKLIEECMLAANETVAQQFATEKLPFIYRVHEAPPAEKVASLQAFLAPLGVSFPDTPQPDDYTKMLSALSDELKPVVTRVALRSMSKADYRPACLGHFGLAAEYYCHFTSPIRRYPDLGIHRIIKQYLHDGPKSLGVFTEFVTSASRTSSESERRAEEAERKVDDFLKAQFFADKIGQEFDAIISGVTDFGLFAETAIGVEGLIRLEDLPPAPYTYVREQHLLTGGGRRYRIGDRIRIAVQAVHFDKISFKEVVAAPVVSGRVDKILI